MRIVAGAWRGRALCAPAGVLTRPTADRLRQAVFDMLLHAPWGGRAVFEQVVVLDAFAGTGALGLEALSRGATRAVFIERDRAALAALRTNITACDADTRCDVLAGDVLAPPPGAPCGVVFLDPPYAQGLVPRALAALSRAGWIAPGALVVAETSHAEASPGPPDPLAIRAHGVGRVTIWRWE